MDRRSVIGFARVNVSRTTLFGASVALIAVTVWLHWPCVHGEFLDVDDKDYLQQAVSWNGLTWTAVKGAFATARPYYHPLPRLSHVLDYQLWGRNAVGHHATGVIVHALNAALVFGFLWTLLGAVSLTPGERLAMAFGAAVVFAVHPFQVESVAWMSGRTQLLCGTFGIGCLWAYVAGARRWVVWGLYMAALLCKPMAVSLPFAMLAIDYFPLRRHERFGWGRLLREKAGLIALAVAVGMATTITEGGVVPWKTFPLPGRVLMMFQCLMFYPWRLVFPGHLAPFYPLRVGPTLNQWPYVVSVLGVGVITALAVWGWRRLPALVAAWGAYVAFVLPVSGLTQGGGAVAPRHAYVAMLPLLLLAGGAGVWLWRRTPSAARLALAGLLACELCIFGASTRALIPEWHNEVTLRRAVLVWFPDSEFDNRMLASALLEQGRASEALEYATQAVEVAPQLWETHMTLGSVLRRLGRQPEAMAQDEQAFQVNDNPAQAHYNFGAALMESGKVPEAVEHFEQALRIAPNRPVTHYNLGSAFDQMGQAQNAIREYNVALRLAPDFAEAHYNLAVLLDREGQASEAIAQYEQALRSSPGYADAHNNLGVTLARVGRVPEAMRHWEEALRIQPDLAKAHNNLGHALTHMDRVPEAIAHLEQALRINPDYAGAHVNLGIALMRVGRVPEAMEQWEQALRLNPDIAEAHFNLAVALEKTGSAREAIDHYQQGLKLQPDFALARNALARLGASQ